MFFDKLRKKRINQEASFAANQVGGILSRNVQEGTKETLKGMKLFSEEIERTQNVHFDQRKGNLFEYIEAAKFNRNAANSGSNHRAVVTAADGRPHDPADIEIVNGNKGVIRQVQAKFVDTQKNGVNTSAAETVNKFRDKKYHGMQRLGRKDDNYAIDPKTNQPISMLEKEKQLADTRASSGGVYAEDYVDVSKNLTDELTDETTGIKSGGTTLEEMKEAADQPQKYVRDFKLKQYGKEVGATAKNTAVSNMVSTGIISGVSNIAACIKNEKDIETAIKDLGVDVGKSGVRGAATGALGAGIRIAGSQASNSVVSTFLSDSSAALVIAGSVIDCGVSVYSFAKGEITGEEFVEELKDTTIKSATTVYFSMAAKAVFGAANPIIPIAIYSIANYVLATTKEIVKNAELNAQEYNRMADLNNEMADLIVEYRQKLMRDIDTYQANYRKSMKDLLDEFDVQILSSYDLDAAVYAIVDYANLSGMALQHTDFGDFKNFLNSDEDYVLK